MANLNKVMLIGIVGKDPKVRDVNGKKAASFSLATTKKWRDQNGEIKEDTQWHNISLFGKVAEVAEKYVKKGSSLYIEGELRSRIYLGQDDITKVITEVQCEVLQLLDKKPTDVAKAPASAPAQQTQAQPAGYNYNPETDLPF